MDAQFEVLAEDLAFPEGPVVMPDGSVIVVEIRAGRLTRIWGDGRKEVVAETGGGPNGAAIGPDGALYVCNNGSNPNEPYSGGRIERVDLSTGRVERLYERVGEHALQTPNDLVFDADGGLWFTDNGRREERWLGKAGIYWCRPDGSAIREEWFGGLGYNGVGLSPDGKSLYVAATPAGRLYRFALAAPGVLSRDKGAGEVFMAGALGEGRFDSLAVTASGSICIGTLTTGGVTTVTPGGDVRFLPLPDTMVTNIAFGGEDMRDAYVTLSRRGRLAKLRWDEPGLKLAF
jgi:gluconolactonase